MRVMPTHHPPAVESTLAPLYSALMKRRSPSLVCTVAWHSFVSSSLPLLVVMSSADLVELVHSLQTQLSQRGAGAFRTLQQAFDVNDRDRTGLFDFAEIEAILAKAGLFLKVRNTTRNGTRQAADAFSILAARLTSEERKQTRV